MRPSGLAATAARFMRAGNTCARAAACRWRERCGRGGARRAEPRVPARAGSPDLSIVGVGGTVALDQPDIWAYVSPVEFIPIADDTGTIVPIGAWGSFDKALDDSSAHLISLTLWCSDVNVPSARQIEPGVHTMGPTDPGALQSSLGDRLRLEITETALLRPTWPQCGPYMSSTHSE